MSQTLRIPVADVKRNVWVESTFFQEDSAGEYHEWINRGICRTVQWHEGDVIRKMRLERGIMRQSRFGVLAGQARDRLLIQAGKAPRHKAFNASTINRIETGKALPTLDAITRQAVALALDCTWDEITDLVPCGVEGYTGEIDTGDADKRLHAGNGRTIVNSAVPQQAGGAVPETDARRRIVQLASNLAGKARSDQLALIETELDQLYARWTAAIPSGSKLNTA